PGKIRVADFTAAAAPRRCAEHICRPWRSHGQAMRASLAARGEAGGDQNKRKVRSTFPPYSLIFIHIQTFMLNSEMKMWYTE
ncbi:MAG: hypothetical protein IKM61_05275, partial [Eubacteriaceae bacterium]|nr:hypothetical protein [Eubacteriaceae bacterium]